MQFLPRILRDYEAQTWPNRELLFVTHGDTPNLPEVKKILKETRITNLCHVHTPDHLNLGQLRQFSVEQAHGEVVCQWDDDDAYHPRRLEQQFLRLYDSGQAACYLRHQLRLLVKRRQLYVTDWSDTGGSPGTLLAWRAQLPGFPSVSRQEDSTVQKQIRSRSTMLEDRSYLHIHCFHGENGFNKSHHEGVCMARSVSDVYLQRNWQKITTELSCFVPEQYDLCCRRGSDILSSRRKVPQTT